ncbi:hypothetical protein [Pseudomonas sp. DNDY-54]|uniref:hypothetical protein n=1 Tax=Pseudomonas sp. DNDY-54 TaxID=2870860 RepID=UPI001CA40BE8|nr:hypothetical protein [Pseudomonas sp. DNDY-54]
MKIELLNTPLLSPAEISDLAGNLEAIHSRTLKAIERLNKDVATKKAEIANRWKSANIDAGDKARIAEQETLASVRLIKDNAQAELDGLLKSAGPAHSALVAQRAFYDSPVKVLTRAALGTAQRTAYLQQLAYAGPSELGHLAQVAVSTKNEPLAAAVLSKLDSMPSKDRPVSAQQLAAAMDLPDFKKVAEYLKIGENRLQGILVAIRAWDSGRSSPINTVSLALRERQIDRSVLEVDDDA